MYKMSVKSYDTIRTSALHIWPIVWPVGVEDLPQKLSEKAKVALHAQITAIYSQLAFEGKGVGVKSVVTLEGQTP